MYTAVSTYIVRYKPNVQHVRIFGLISV